MPEVDHARQHCPACVDVVEFRFVRPGTVIDGTGALVLTKPTIAVAPCRFVHYSGRRWCAELGTCAAAHAARHGYYAIWLTPLLHLPEIVEAMSEHPSRQLLVGGTDDPAWSLERARAISGEVTQIEGADHGMFTVDAVRTAQMQVEVVSAIDHWLRFTP